MKKAYIPLVIFAVLVIFLAIGLTRDPREIPSPLIGKPAPDFSAPNLHNATLTLTKQDMLGKVWLLNTWASWCVACREEHPLLVEFSKSKMIPIIGLDYKDKDQDGLQWLARYGNPYDMAIADRDGRIGINFGVYGVPESFLIDKAGTIRYKQIGPFTETSIQEKLIPLIRELQK
ncbi:MAG: DsbE family thiol:disulfide interchange protein [Comamonadaceae bacterium CG_4_9_14_0_8_um_filter_60_18]|nr:DsbE family thiol:disulfide interchange protein [Rhodoferax sp.]OIP25508.1 MAG: thiol:disulfide interchange protein [Comamonadaceae bacterium CG2_30_60_41]PIW10418.1 MAG: DsbE family thiol:disulfide interchange protein [Comamonadaceae bacterium CG17_big_fil_post_rev_8_21_14_2_50_60_13]PIY25154.1 MAG: DsbE family thiol:disulfide interchange protein [Comamonadaceae bacterium CG_4_10_14_3_um_filter_60_75]PJC14396.1 MAG: DsbE family thiol:disulfide interchange protein [Comamonadaceae bacterium C